MDLLQISRKIWRRRIVTLPVVVLTLLGAFYVVALKAPVYSASSSFVLINPPLPPTAEEIARNPALGRINSDNPYTRFPDQSVIVGLLSSSLSNKSARQALSGKGADPRYTVAPASQFATSSLLVDVTGVASTPQEAMKSAELVGAGLTGELDRMQASQGVDPHYRITAQRVVAPDHAEQRLSGKLRPLVGVLAMGAILLFVVVSAAEGLAALRAEWSTRSVPQEPRKGEPIEGTATNNSPVHQGSWQDRPLSTEPGPTMDGMTGLTWPERTLRALSFRSDGTLAPPGELTLPGSGLSERTGIEPESMDAVTSKLRNEGKIERDERGWWKLSAPQRTADNGHPPQGAPDELMPNDWTKQRA